MHELIRPLLVMCFLTQFTGTALASALEEEILSCAGEHNNEKRLQCYDNIADKYQPAHTPHYIQPQQEFLASRLTTKPWEPEFNLTVQDFVNLISNAVMENGKKIVLRGWTKQDRQYVLHIVMRTPVQLRFQPRETETDKIPMTLLKEVERDGQETDPELFVMVIASMIPDEQDNAERKR